MGILIKNCTALLRDGIRINTDIGINNHTITKIDDNLNADQYNKIIDGQNKLVIPGFANTHTHLPMVLLRGITKTFPLTRWLETIWQYEKLLTPRDIYWGSLLGCIELIQSGTTLFSDMYFHMEEVAKAVEQIGIRAVLGYGMIDNRSKQKADEEIQICINFIDEWLNKNNLITLSVAPHSIYTVSDYLWKKAVNIATQKSLILHTHLCELPSETDYSLKHHGSKPCQYLKHLGVLNLQCVLAHGIYLEDSEFGLLQQNNINISHCPVSNAKINGAVAPIRKLSGRNINITLGTDGAAANNNISIIEQMFTAKLFTDTHGKDESIIDFKTIFKWATKNGYSALGIKNGGELDIGSIADLLIIDLNKPHLNPIHDYYSSIVCSLQPDDIQTVIINGAIVMENRKITNINLDEVIYNVNKIAAKLKLNIA